MMKRVFATAVTAAAIAVACTGSASATIYTVDFTIDPTASDPWFGIGTGDNPFGLSADPVLSGSFQVDDATRTGNSSGTASVSDMSYVTGSTTWTTSGLTATIGYAGQDITGFSLFWTPQNYVMTNTVQIHDPATGQGLGCNGCVTFTATPQAVAGAAPEPASWALMIAGFGLAGAALRRRRPLAAA